MPQEVKELYLFGSFRLDVGEHTLERIDGLSNGSLPDKAFQTLVYLVRNNAQLVTKEALLQAVWPNTIVEENNLDKSIHAIRRVLGETPGENKYIETILKYGYRFVADVSTVSLPMPKPRITPSGAHAIINMAEWRNIVERIEAKKGRMALALNDTDAPNVKKKEDD